MYSIGDFGFAKKAEEITGTVLGTGQYMCPEIFMCETYGLEVDMWAVGVILFFMLNGEYPFSTNKLKKR